MSSKLAQGQGEGTVTVQDIKKTPYYQPTQTERNLSNAHAYILSLVKALRHRDPRVRGQALVGLERYMQPFGDLVNRIIRGASSIDELISLADDLDSVGEYQLANRIDDILKTNQFVEIGRDAISDMQEVVSNIEAKTDMTCQLAKFANYMDSVGLYKIADNIDETLGYGFFPKERPLEEESKEPELVQPPREGSLSTRYCPDHIGVQAARISERVYQCPIDGKVYNYELGYENYQGQKVPGGSIAAQTPTSSNYGGIPMRIYDSRQSILNKVN